MLVVLLVLQGSSHVLALLTTKRTSRSSIEDAFVTAVFDIKASPLELAINITHSCYFL